MDTADHYDASCFAWQKEIGAFGGVANKIKFEEFIKPTDRALDFRCGGGFLLANLRCAERLGIEINEAARANARKLGVNAVPCDTLKMKYQANEINQHLHSWGPLNLRNLFKHAGFEAVSLVGWRAFHALCRLYARWGDAWFQTRVIARRLAAE